mmetsp:Transcript_22091/g.48828  ORF Transcript_22091/g.48828 Transcript_22091/m.48828 type:complete len:261 (+) Transcript_22091:981-1763(+)
MVTGLRSLLDCTLSTRLSRCEADIDSQPNVSTLRRGARGSRASLPFGAFAGSGDVARCRSVRWTSAMDKVWPSFGNAAMRMPERGPSIFQVVVRPNAAPSSSPSASWSPSRTVGGRPSHVVAFLLKFAPAKVIVRTFEALRLLERRGMSSFPSTIAPVRLPKLHPVEIALSDELPLGKSADSASEVNDEEQVPEAANVATAGRTKYSAGRAPAMTRSTSAAFRFRASARSAALSATSSRYVAPMLSHHLTASGIRSASPS